MAALAALVLLAGCSGKPRQQDNTIGPMTLNEDQQGIVDLLGMGEGTLLFDFEAPALHTRFEIWVEIYKNGQLVEENAAGLSTGKSSPDAWKGRLAVTIRETPDFYWSFALENGEGGISRAATSEPYPHPGTSARAFSALDSPAPIEDGKEIVLFAGVYTDSDSFAVYDTQEYLTSPDWIAEQENLHLIKCKFSK